MKRSYFVRLLIVLVLCLILTISAIAHPGRLDSSGGHYVRSPGHGYPVGSYHYHDGVSNSDSSHVEKVLNAMEEVPIEPPVINMSFSNLPDKLYVGESIEIKVDVPRIYRDDLAFSLFNDFYAKLDGNILTATGAGTATVTVYLNEKSSISQDIEIFCPPREVITLASEREYAFVGIPFEVRSDAYFLTKKDAPEWTADNVITYSADNANIKISKDFEGIYVTFNSNANFEETISVKGNHGGYNEILVKVYNLNQSLTIIFVVLLTFFLVFLIIVFIKKYFEHK